MSVLELVDGLGDPDDAYKRKVKKGAHHVDIFYVLALFIPMLIALNDRLKRFPPAPFPSDLVQSSHKLADLFFWVVKCFPSILVGLVVSLSRSLDNLKQVQVSRSEVDRAAKYLRCAIAFYEDEAHRQNAIKELVDESIGEKGEWGYNLSWADNIKPDRSWWYDSLLLLVLELKNTLGLSGDALLQAVFDYSKIVLEIRFDVLYVSFCMP